MKEMAKEPCCKPMNKKLAKVLFSRLWQCAQWDAFYLGIITILSNFGGLSWLWCNVLHLCKIVKLLDDSFIGGNCKIVMIDVPLVI
jgi:hypothetical protein